MENIFQMKSAAKIVACLKVKRVAVIAIALCISLTAAAQYQGDMAAGLNAVGGSYGGGDVPGIGFGAKLLYNVTDPVRLAGEFDYSKGQGGKGYIDIPYNFLDVSLYGHYLFHLNENMVIYPLVGVGLWKVKMEAKFIGQSFSDSGNRTVATIGFGSEYALTDRLGVGGEVRLKLHGGSHYIVAVGISYKF